MLSCDQSVSAGGLKALLQDDVKAPCEGDGDPMRFWETRGIVEMGAPERLMPKNPCGCFERGAAEKNVLSGS